MIRFLHTSDWQLGMSRRFLAGEAQERFAAARLDAIRSIGELAERTRAAFIVVAGDVFETNQVSAQTLARALDKLAAIAVPVYLLPGNHDPLDAGSIYHRPVWREPRLAHVRILRGEEPEPVPDVTGVEVLGAPWYGKRPEEDLCARALQRAPVPAPGVKRVLVGHGAIDVLNPNEQSLSAISLRKLEAALDEGRCHYVALGDRHSATSFGALGAVRYSGSPEPTRFEDSAAGFVLEVELGDEGAPRVTAHAIGTWTFRESAADLASRDDVAAFERALRELPDKDRCIAAIALRGSLSIEDMARLEEVLDEVRPSYAALLRQEPADALVLRPAALDAQELALSGYGLEAWRRLESHATSDAADAAEASDALVLFHRLAREVRR